MGDVYSDPLIRISDEGVCVRGYYLPGLHKLVCWEQIESVRALLPTLWNGRWRLSGTGTFRTWFASDFGRPARETIFVMTLRTQRVRVGFTVHDSPRVKTLFRERGLLIDEQGDALPAALPEERRPMWRWGAFSALLAALGLFIAQALYYYPQLPQRVATHFNASGQADGWGSKAQLTLVMLIAATIVSFLTLAISYAISRSAAAAFGRMTLWFAVVTVLLVLAMANLTFRANLSPEPSLGAAPWWLIGAYLVCLPVMMVLMMRRLAG